MAFDNFKKQIIMWDSFTAWGTPLMTQDRVEFCDAIFMEQVTQNTNLANTHMANEMYSMNAETLFAFLYDMDVHPNPPTPASMALAADVNAYQSYLEGLYMTDVTNMVWPPMGGAVVPATQTVMITDFSSTSGLTTWCVPETGGTVGTPYSALTTTFNGNRDQLVESQDYRNWLQARVDKICAEQL
jgi:hypothetical protein